MPKLKAVPICTKVPKEICNYDPHGSKRVIKKPLVSIYCREVQSDFDGSGTEDSGIYPGVDGGGIPNNGG